jgi:hypothetical protein
MRLGVAVCRSVLDGSWSGWVAIARAALVLVQLSLTGDALPAAYHLGPAVVGISLLI